MDRKFLLAILETSEVSVDYAAVAAKLSTSEQECTVVAVKKRLQKLRALVKAGDVTPKAKGKTTPRKRQAASAEDESPTKMMKHSLAAKGLSEMEELNDDNDETVYFKQEE
nr:hypothetical protein CFP56_33732 [Quercus suber]